MIKINKSDSIIDIIIKIKWCKDKEIVLEFPFWHPILHNYTSLKILKTKAWKKELVIITNDKTSKRIWKKLWIKYNLITKEEVPDSQYSFWEYFLYTLKNYFIEAKNFFSKKARENTFAKYQKLYTNGKIGFFLIFLLLSIILFIFIFFFAVNHTYIKITPEIDFRTKSRNFVFEVMAEWASANSNIVKLKEIKKTTNISIKIITTWIDEKETKNANGQVKIFNFTEKDAYLIKNSRLVTTEWVVFLLDNEVKIPAMTVDEQWNKTPWEVLANVTSRLADINWVVIWDRWNIKSWITLSFPWLTEDKDKIYAMSTIDFSWWKASYKKIVSSTDLENAKKILRWKLEQSWLDEIKNELIAENKVSNVKYEILWASWMIKYDNFKYSWLENIKAWDELDEFQISGSLDTIVYAFNKEVVLNKLKNEIKETTLSNIESIYSIDENSLSIVNELWREEKPFRIKATAQITVWYTENFYSETNNYAEKLKYQIAWLTKEEAEKILINTWKISNVDIKIRPFFINNISKIIDNITFE